MRKTGKMTAVLMAAVLGLAMAAGCGQESAETTGQGGSAAGGEALKIGVVQMMDNGAFSDMREGYMDRLKELYPDREVEFIYENAQGDASALNTICQQMADSDLDAVATIATPASQAMVNMEIDTPVFFVAVSDPVGAGLITDMEKPDKNATGTSNAIPVEDIFALCDELTPGCQTYGLLYNTSEANSVSTVEKAKEYLDSKGLSYVEQVVTNSSEVQQAAQALMGQVDAVFVPNDSMIQSAMSLVTEAAREAKVPVYGSSAVMVESGAFATIAVSDREIGAMTAEMTKEYLDGKAVTEIPSIVVPASSTVINQTTADALDITFADKVKQSATFVTE